MTKKNIIMGSIIGIFIFAWLAVAIFDFSFRLNVVLQNKTNTNLEEISKQTTNVFEAKLEEQIQILRTAGETAIQYDNSSKENIYQVLTTAAKIGGFDRVYSSLPNGDAYFGGGIEENVKTHSYFEKAALGEMVISTPTISGVNGESVIVIAVPVKENGTVIRIICGVYSLDKADKIFLESSYYGEGYGFIVASNGDFVLGGANERRLSQEENFFDFFKKAQFKNDYSVEQFRKDIEQKKSGTFSIVYEGEERFVSFTPTQVNDWYCLTFATNVVMHREKESVSEIVLILTMKMILAFALIVAFILMMRHRHSRALNFANQEYESLLSNVTGGVIRSSMEEDVREIKAIYLSKSFTEITGYTMEDMYTILGGKTCGIIYSEDLETVLEEYSRQVKETATYNLQYRVKTKNGTIIWVMDNGRVLGNGTIHQSILMDITQIKEQEAELKLSEERFRIATRLSNGVVFEFDYRKEEYTYFENAEQIFGMGDKEFLEKSNLLQQNSEDGILLSRLYHEDDIQSNHNQKEKLKQGQNVEYEARIPNQNGKDTWCRIFLYPVLNEQGKLARSVGHIMNITAEREKTEYLKAQAQIDALTGVYNKISSQKMIDDDMSHAFHKKQALLMLDIDNFKGANDTQGHAFGDKVLTDVGTGLNQIADSSDILGRIGGDEFIFFVSSYKEQAEVLQKAQSICDMFQNNEIGNRKEYKVSCSIGIAFCEGETTFQELFEKADRALYQAKAAGKSCYQIYGA